MEEVDGEKSAITKEEFENVVQTSQENARKRAR